MFVLHVVASFARSVIVPSAAWASSSSLSGAGMKAISMISNPAFAAAVGAYRAKGLSPASGM